MVIGRGYRDRFLSTDELRAVLEEGLGSIAVSGRKLLFIIPDSTRSGPFDLCFRLLVELLAPEAAQLDFMVALGTHRPMSEEQLCQHLGISPQECATRYARVGLLNHDWQGELRLLGTIGAAEVAELSEGRMQQEVPVRINPRIFDYDRVIILGPVFPHEVVGFSGGNKYFFPGISGAEIIDFTHWLSALITNMRIIGVQNTPVRRVLDRAAAMIDMEKSCISLVVKGHRDLAGAYFGAPEESQAAAAALSAQVNVVYVARPYRTVLSVMPTLYDDIWTAAKGMYKMEPVVADGGRVIIYAPHIDELSYTHGRVLDRIGYHVRDYFLAHMDELADVPKGVMAHSTHCKGAGTYENGVERPRVEVVLATGVPRERCERVNLGYIDPQTIDPQEWAARDDQDLLVVPRAGELLYRLRSD